MSQKKIDVYYDGDCFFCKRFAVMTKIKQKHDISLYNLRNDSWEIKGKRKELTAMGFVLDEWMVVSVDGKYYHWPQAVAVVLSHSKNTRLLTKLAQSRFFPHLYPYINSVRKIVLRLSHKKVSFS